jgi:maltose/moltooligosaccharide transporter
MASIQAPMDTTSQQVDKPHQSFWGLWNISFGFLGIQFAFGLQNGNTSRIFQALGSDVESLAFLWIAGPVTGLLVQPIVGHYSDRHWGKLGRRRPFFLAGAILVALSLIAFPFAPVAGTMALFFAAMCLWILDASLNVAMEPFRAFVGDMTRSDQRAAGYGIQTVLIGIGAVLGSGAGYAMTALGISNTAPAGQIPPNVVASFYLGAVVILIAVAWTVLRVKEYSPQEMATFNGEESPEASAARDALVIPKQGITWLLVGALLGVLVNLYALDKQLYVLAFGLAGFGLLQLVNQYASAGKMVREVLSDLFQMPKPMQRLAVVQFFSWIGLFIMWIYTSTVVSQYTFGSTDVTSKAFGDGGDWWGIMAVVYNAVSAVAGFILPGLARKHGAAMTHALCLGLGAISFLALFFIRDQYLLLVPMIGIGFAWASILSMPYVMLADVLPQHKLGVYMGIFNFFITLPQLVIATIMGVIIKGLFPEGQPIYTMLCAAIAMGAAAVAMVIVSKQFSR